MPVIEQLNIGEINLHIWKIAEDEAFFIRESAAADLSQLRHYRHPQARLQWLASRMMLLKILGLDQYKKLSKNDKGKPVLEENDLQISISHSDNLVAVAFSKTNFGIDIQKFTDKIPLVSGKFIPEETLMSIKDLPDFVKICHVHWGVKEALFKADVNGSLDYRKNLILEWDNCYCEDGGNFKASILRDDNSITFTAKYVKILKDFILCTATEM